METIFLGMAALACPIGMGLMMWFMAKGMTKDRSQARPSASALDDLRAEHERLGEEIERLETDDGAGRDLSEVRS